MVEKAQFTNVNEHFETISNAAMAKKTTHAMVSNYFRPLPNKYTSRLRGRDASGLRVITF